MQKPDRYAKYDHMFADRESIANEQMAWRRWVSNRTLPHPDGGTQMSDEKRPLSPRTLKHKSFKVAGVKVR